MPAVTARGAVLALVLSAFLFGAAGASVLFVGVWRYEASRAKAADAEVQEVTKVATATSAKLRKAQTRLERQLQRVAKLRAAAKPVVAEAGALGSASQQLAAEGASVADSAAKLAAEVDGLAAYLKGTNLVELDPAYVDGRLAAIVEQVAALEARAGKLASGAKGVAGSRDRIAARADALAKLAK